LFNLINLIIMRKNQKSRKRDNRGAKFSTVRGIKSISNNVGYVKKLNRQTKNWGCRKLRKQ